MLGRFIQPDSIVPEPGNPQSLNRYSYAGNNPITYSDPTGHAQTIDAPMSGPFWIPVEPINIDLSGFFGALGAALTVSTLSLSIDDIVRWVIADEGPDYPYPLDFALGEIAASYPLPGTTTVGIELPTVLAVKGPAVPLAQHLQKLTGGELQFPGVPPIDPNQYKDKRPGGGTERHWLNEVNSQLRTYIRKYPGQTLDKILQRYSGYSAEEAAKYVDSLSRFGRNWLPMLENLPEMNPVTIQEFRELATLLGVTVP